MSTSEEYVKKRTFASLPRTTRGLPLVLSASSDSKNFVYCNGNSVYIRSVDDSTNCDIYTEHAIQTTVAKFSPSGFYCASGDQSGKVRIWDTTQETHILKAEYPVIAGPIRDIAWSDDSKRLAVVGEAREKFGHVFLFDTGTSNGNLSGQSRSMSSIDFRPVRPYRLISASEDNTVALFEGPPFKFKTLFREHQRFVHCVRYNADGTVFASAGADGKVILYEGVEGEKIGEFVDDNCKGNAHSGGVFALSWSPCGQRIATASGDKTCKIWNVASKQLEKTFTFGNAVEDQQLAILWLKTALISVSLAGFISYLDVKTGSVAKTLKGHFKPITAAALSVNKEWLFTSDFEGNITRWNVNSGDSERVAPVVHKSQVSGLGISPDGLLMSIGWDDTISFTPNTPEAIDNVRPNTIKLGSQPRGMSSSASGETVAVACHKAVIYFKNQKQTALMNIPFEATCIALHPDEKTIVVGSMDNKVRIFEVSGDRMDEKKVVSHAGAITSVAWSPNGELLVAADAARKVIPYRKSADYAVASDKEWSFHTARVNCVSWSSNSRYVASGGLDTNIMIWDMQNSGEHPLMIKGAHAMSPVNCVLWLSDNRILSIGQDSNIKEWEVKLQ
ncbi:hypothetical protein QR680_017490 [Steinernema hermaphroditum]|uniref:Actin-interacting protein 1 n=1 Tax=Steinernema hermaphroditum TaxID=289476 RepID=A0AA39LPE6_9BILA|nr:hypothetical protein QR680_017490 [Steinernema hermaphroditum]